MNNTENDFYKVGIRRFTDLITDTDVLRILWRYARSAWQLDSNTEKEGDMEHELQR